MTLREVKKVARDYYEILELEGYESCYADGRFYPWGKK